MAVGVARWWRAVVAAVVVVGLIPAAGCNRGLRRIPVSGTVTMDGKPMGRGVLMFHPDPAKGNTARAGCTGPISNGQYKLVTTAVTKDDTGPGAPLGWYKVTLLHDLPGMAEIKVHPRFLSPQTTPIEIEIVENPAPGAYDIKLTTD
jgi:hypothetical protein